MNPRPKTQALRISGPKYKRLQEAVAQRDDFQCQICGKHTEDPPHHIRYRSDSGPDIMDNLAMVCADCHYSIHHGSLSDVIETIEAFYGLKHVLRYFLQGVVLEKGEE